MNITKIKPTSLKPCMHTQSPSFNPAFMNPAASLRTMVLACRAEMLRLGFAASMYICASKMHGQWLERNPNVRTIRSFQHTHTHAPACPDRMCDHRTSTTEGPSLDIRDARLLGMAPFVPSMFCLLPSQIGARRTIHKPLYRCAKSTYREKAVGSNGCRNRARG